MLLNGSTVLSYSQNISCSLEANLEIPIAGLSTKWILIRFDSIFEIDLLGRSHMA